MDPKTDSSDTESRFDIPTHPSRHYPRDDGVEYRGKTVFQISPAGEDAIDDLEGLVVSTLEQEAYTYGDWFELPVPLYTVHDEVTGDVFRVAVKPSHIEFHVLPATEPAGLERLFDCLQRAGAVDAWEIGCEVE